MCPYAEASDRGEESSSSYPFQDDQKERHDSIHWAQISDEGSDVLCSDQTLSSVVNQLFH